MPGAEPSIPTRCGGLEYLTHLRNKLAIRIAAGYLGGFRPPESQLRRPHDARGHPVRIGVTGNMGPIANGTCRQQIRDMALRRSDIEKWNSERQDVVHLAGMDDPTNGSPRTTVCKSAAESDPDSLSRG